MSLSRLHTEIARSLRVVREGSASPGLVAALSGGADSVALLHVLHALSHRLGFPLVAAHLDHGLRPEAGEDAAFCRRLCRALGVPLRVGRADVRARAKRDGGGIEEAARLVRRAFLERVRAREGARWIVLAHTRDDQAETVLLRLLRGSGSAGLGAMRVRAGRLLRPMLAASRRDVLDHLAAHGLAWRDDPSNADPAFLRNRVRHELIPYLEARFNPKVRESLARTASVLAGEADVLAALAAAIAVREEGGAAVLDRAAVTAAPRAVARVAMRSALRMAGGLRGIALDHVDAILDLAARPGASGRRIPLPGAREAGIHFGEIRIGRVTARPPAVEAALEVPGRVPLPDGRILVARPVRRPGPSATGVPSGPLTVRTRRPGDRVRARGREISLKRFLADRRVPAAERDLLPVIAAGRTVVWVQGQPVDGAPDAPRQVRLRVIGTARKAAATFPDVQIRRSALTMKKTSTRPGRAAK
jgi:tRNA(Ile)-lysidine synthase